MYQDNEFPEVHASGMGKKVMWSGIRQVSIVLILLLFIVNPAKSQPLPTGGSFSYVGEVTKTLLVGSWAAMGVGVADSSGGEALYIPVGMWCGSYNAFVVEVDPDTSSLLVTTYLLPGNGEYTVWGATMGRDSALYFSIKESEKIYRFDLRSKTFSDLGVPPFPVCANAAYSMTAGPDRKIYFASYAGITSCGIHLGVYDPDLDTMIYLGLMDTLNRYPQNMIATSNDLYITASTEDIHLYRYNFAGQTVTQILSPANCCISGFCDIYRNDSSDIVLFMHNTGNGQKKYCILDTLTDSLISCVPYPPLPAYTQSWPELADGRKYFLNGSTMKLTFKHPNNSTSIHSLSSDRSSSCAFTLANGADGNIYSGVQPMSMVQLDPAADSIMPLGNPTGTTGEVYSMISKDSLLWMASYPRGNLSVLNFNQPYALVNSMAGSGSNDNPRSLCNILNYQERPFDIQIGPDDNIYMAFKADYGGSTGSITQYNPVTDTFAIFQPYPGKSIYGLEVVGNDLWAVSEDKLFQWDYSGNNILFDTLAPCVAGKHTRIVYCPLNQTLYGICNQDMILYAFDPVSKQFLSQSVLDSCDQNFTEHYRRMAVGPDGLVYCHCPNTQRKKSYLYVIDPQNHQPSIIGHWDADSSGMTGTTLSNGIAFSDENIYLPSGSHLVKFTKAYDTLGIAAGRPLNEQIIAYPNPTSDILKVQINTEQSGQIHWIIHDLNGKPLDKGMIESSAGINILKVDIAELSNGVYLICLDNGETSYSSKFVIVR